MPIQYEKQPCDHIGGSFVAVDKAVVSGKTESVCGRKIKYVRVICYYALQYPKISVR